MSPHQTIPFGQRESPLRRRTGILVEVVSCGLRSVRSQNLDWCSLGTVWDWGGVGPRMWVGDSLVTGVDDWDLGLVRTDPEDEPELESTGLRHKVTSDTLSKTFTSG